MPKLHEFHINVWLYSEWESDKLRKSLDQSQLQLHQIGDFRKEPRGERASSVWEEVRKAG